jgi:DNA-binding GntR family transcriptional regulator
VRPDAVYAELRSRILSGVDAPGVAITESAVALRHGITRPTAKIAIERLVGEGLLHREPHRAARVPVLGRDDIVDLFTTRAIVETAAIEALAHAGTLPAAALAAHRELLDRARRDEPFAELDIAFHRAIVAGQPSPRLARLHTLLMGEIELCIAHVQASRLLTASEVAAQHQGILDAVIAGDADRAGTLARAHIHGARDRLVAHADRSEGR